MSYCESIDEINQLKRTEDDEKKGTEGYTNPTNKRTEPSLPSTSYDGVSDKYRPLSYSSSEDIRVEGDGKAAEDSCEEEVKILTVLRDVAKKCTVPNPMKRPTAKEVLKMIEDVAPSELLTDRISLSDEDDDDVAPAARKKFL